MTPRHALRTWPAVALLAALALGSYGCSKAPTAPRAKSTVVSPAGGDLRRTGRRGPGGAPGSGPVGVAAVRAGESVHDVEPDPRRNDVQLPPRLRPPESDHHPDPRRDRRPPRGLRVVRRRRVPAHERRRRDVRIPFGAIARQHAPRVQPADLRPGHTRFPDP